ncbi:hypothetical protein DIPPA_02622 [Diplonema papillatum]|nr:hypothetical protein DIPPA_02622 [Diplonema papillatum]
MRRSTSTKAKKRLHEQTLTDVLMLGLNGPYERGSGIPRSAMEAYLNAWIASPRTLNFATWPEYEACVDKEGAMRKIR